MNKFVILEILLCCVLRSFVLSNTSEEDFDFERCCEMGEKYGRTKAKNRNDCLINEPPEDIQPKNNELCVSSYATCCTEYFNKSERCKAGMQLADNKKCSVADGDIANNCCEECSLGRLTGESLGEEACGGPPGDDISVSSILRKEAYRKCCLEAANAVTTTISTTTVETTTAVPDPCKNSPCAHICQNENGEAQCLCRPGYRLAEDDISCNDINECADSDANLCTDDSTVCHNTPGSYKCIPLKKREARLSCPPGFKMNVRNQVCDDINECQLPRPPCPKYLCENTIGAYKCGGKLRKPATEEVPGAPTPAPGSSTTAADKDDMCPPGFRAGPDDECVDIDECTEQLDDCQRLSQHCINTHGTFFCQDHVSKRCAPGFQVNSATGICEDIDECEESMEVCKRNEICVNLPGAYNCKSKISTLPRLSSKTCQEGTRLRPGGTVCEDIDECREGTHLCDRFQNCINTFGGHECRCKNGFELDSNSGSCIDVDECALKLDNCAPELFCLNVLGSFTCTKKQSSSGTLPPYEYEEYDYEDEINNNETYRTSVQSSSTTKLPPITTTRRIINRRPPTTTPRPTTVLPTTRRPIVRTTTISRPTTTNRISTTIKPTTPSRPPTTSRPTSTSTPITSRPRRPYTRTEPSVSRPTPERPYNETVDRRNQPVPFTSRPPTPRSNGRPVYSRTESTRRNETRDKEVNTPNRNNGDFNIDFLHCLDGLERNEHGDCVDIDECKQNKYICGSNEVCKNFHGSYLCECAPEYHKDASGWCVPLATTTSTTTSTTSTTTPQPRIPPTSTTTERNSLANPDWTYAPPSPPRAYNPAPVLCELGYRFDMARQRCIDIDECATGRAKCGVDERCMNVEGGYRCVCTKQRCLPTSEEYTPSYVIPPSSHNNQPNIVTVGSQYGQRGPMYVRPNFSRVNSGSVMASCPWGYKLNNDQKCQDIDECSSGSSVCGAEQRCENFYGGYSCQCPAGHRLDGERCVDVNECDIAQPCSINGRCINTISSYRCECGPGFRNAPANDKVCVDIDECAERPGTCQHGCINSWGGYRCTCDRGYRLHSDNRTCADIDECSEWSSRRGRLCVGECVNVAGSFRCECPPGYRLAEDGRSCVDIDECEVGTASCASGDPSVVCQNTRGSYHCHKISCPQGYRLEHRHRCIRIQRSCPYNDWQCLRQPGTYSYNFITFVSNLYLPSGSVDLFTMHGPAWSDSVTNFELNMVGVHAPPHVKTADISCFDVRSGGSSCAVSLRCALQGPQVAELELTMTLHRREQFAGSAVAKLILIVSQYDF